MYKLSSLPVEILYSIWGHLDTNDIITVARLNSWYCYRLSTLLGERIDHHVKSDGWRIHIDVLAKSYPSHQVNSSFPFLTELLLLSEYARINPFTLTLEFNLSPVDKEGLNAVKSATRSHRSIVLFDKIKTDVEIVAYFVQISSINQRLQHVNQAGAAIMTDIHLLSFDNKEKNGTSVMGTGLKIQNHLTTNIQDNKDMSQLVDQFKLDYNELDVLPLLKDESPAVMSFDKAQVSPEWWLKQMEISSYNNCEQQEPRFLKLAYW